MCFLAGRFSLCEWLMISFTGVLSRSMISSLVVAKDSFLRGGFPGRLVIAATLWTYLGGKFRRGTLGFSSLGGALPTLRTQYLSGCFCLD